MLLKKGEFPSGNYDVAIIGSGLAGMTAANKLAKNGRKVLLVEAHNKLGGFATWFKRKQGEYIFDISLHGFPVGMIKTCKKYWSRDIANDIVQVKKVRFVNPQFEITTDFTKENYIEILIDQFKLEREVVMGFFDELAQMNYYDASAMTNGELFQKYFPDRNDVIRFLLEPIVYANGSNLDDPAISYGIVFSNFMSKGVYIFKGGTDQLIFKMRDELIKNGVDIKLHTKISKISFDTSSKKSRANGIFLNDKLVKAKSVLSNANLKATVLNLSGKEHFSNEYISETEQTRLNTSSCQVYMGLKKGETIPDVGELIFYSEDSEFNTDKILSPKIGSQTFSIYYPELRPQLNNHYAIVSSSNARYEDWAKLDPEEYKEQKKYLIERALECVEKVIPGVREKIDFVDAATPLTVERYTHHLQGASFGTKFEGLPVSMNMHKEVDGLFHSGSVGIIMSGWLGAANYGVIQSHEVENYLSKQENI